MEYKNRYQKAAYALEWADRNKKMQKEAAVEFGIHRPQLITNVAALRRKRSDLYKKVFDGTVSYNHAYKIYKLEAGI